MLDSSPSHKRPKRSTSTLGVLVSTWTVSMPMDDATVGSGRTPSEPILDKGCELGCTRPRRGVRFGPWIYPRPMAPALAATSTVTP